ncbi:MAG: DUF3489 domain-containing protein [Pseudolabrys sp.]
MASLVTATQWQQHSVRGFLAGVVRKKLGLNLVSEQTDKGVKSHPSATPFSRPRMTPLTEPRPAARSPT